MRRDFKKERTGLEVFNNEGYLMRIVKYINSGSVIVEFQDEYKQVVTTSYDHFIKGKVSNPQKIRRIGEIKNNNQGCTMKIIEYNNSNDIVLEFQDDYKFTKRTSYVNFVNGCIDNPFHPTVFGVGILGSMHGSTSKCGKSIKEYTTWKDMLERCFGDKYEGALASYKNVTCCKEWVLFENFYNWIHSQSNFDLWQNNSNFEIDKDILVKNNKTYSPETCCLVPKRVNYLFIKKESCRGDLPIGVTRHKGKYMAQCGNKKNDGITLGVFDTPEEAFQVYKEYKESVIKQVAKEEFDKCSITQACYDAMMKYEVEITD